MSCVCVVDRASVDRDEMAIVNRYKECRVKERKTIVLDATRYGKGNLNAVPRNEERGRPESRIQ
jgi:hypothetical protein